MLDAFEIQILRECVGELPASPWGAAVGAAIETLTGSGYWDKETGLTDKGRAVLTQPLSYWDLCRLVAPGWALREGYADGPAAEGPIWLWAPTYEDAVWRTWCHLFGYWVSHDDLYGQYVWPERPNDWRDRIAQARKIWDESQARGRKLLEHNLIEPED
jgi:hypothetical protein